MLYLKKEGGKVKLYGDLRRMGNRLPNYLHAHIHETGQTGPECMRAGGLYHPDTVIKKVKLCARLRAFPDYH